MNATQVYKKVGADFYELGAVIEKLESERDAAIRERDEARKQADEMKGFFEAAREAFGGSKVGTVETKPIRKRAATKPKPIATGDKNDAALIEALQETKDVSKDFVTADKLFEVALTNGFSLSRVSVRNRMAKLVKANPDRIIEQKTPALAWRLVD